MTEPRANHGTDTALLDATGREDEWACLGSPTATWKGRC
jgi:hypothetical protein